MNAKDFNELLKSIDEVRAIMAGKRKPSRVITFNPLRRQPVGTSVSQPNLPTSSKRYY
ncbi:MAG: hypothetical protein HYY57_06670 [Candidatus Omnitrophica bacterium]|nr:hypothetical protein [Candidatus Omnitrophota bacterium]